MSYGNDAEFYLEKNGKLLNQVRECPNLIMTTAGWSSGECWLGGGGKASVGGCCSRMMALPECRPWGWDMWLGVKEKEFNS